MSSRTFATASSGDTQADGATEREADDTLAKNNSKKRRGAAFLKQDAPFERSIDSSAANDNPMPPPEIPAPPESAPIPKTPKPRRAAAIVVGGRQASARLDDTSGHGPDGNPIPKPPLSSSGRQNSARTEDKSKKLSRPEEKKTPKARRGAAAGLMGRQGSARQSADNPSPSEAIPKSSLGAPVISPTDSSRMEAASTGISKPEEKQTLAAPKARRGAAAGLMGRQGSARQSADNPSQPKLDDNSSPAAPIGKNSQHQSTPGSSAGSIASIPEEDALAALEPAETGMSLGPRQGSYRTADSSGTTKALGSSGASSINPPKNPKRTPGLRGKSSRSNLSATTLDDTAPMMKRKPGLSGRQASERISSHSLDVAFNHSTASSMGKLGLSGRQAFDRISSRSLGVASEKSTASSMGKPGLSGRQAFDRISALSLGVASNHSTGKAANPFSAAEPNQRLLGFEGQASERSVLVSLPEEGADPTAGGLLGPEPGSTQSLQVQSVGSLSTAPPSLAPPPASSATSAANNTTASRPRSPMRTNSRGKSPPRTKSRGMSPIRAIKRGLSPARITGATGRRGLRKKKTEDDSGSLGGSSHHAIPKRNTTADDILAGSSHSSGLYYRMPPQVSGNIISSNSGHQLAGNSNHEIYGSSAHSTNSEYSEVSSFQRNASGDSVPSHTDLNLAREFSGEHGDVYTKLPGFNRNVSEAYSEVSSLNDSSGQQFLAGMRHRRSNSFDLPVDDAQCHGSSTSRNSMRRNHSFDGSDRALGSRTGAFNAKGHGLRKSKMNDNIGHSASGQVGAFAGTGRGLRKNRNTEGEESTQSFHTTKIGGTSVPSTSGLHAVHRQAEIAKIRGLSPGPTAGLRHNNAPTKDGMKLATKSTDAFSPTEFRPTTMSTANQLLGESTEDGQIPTIDPDRNAKGGIRFFGGKGSTPNETSTTQLHRVVEAGVEADLLKKKGSKNNDSGSHGMERQPSTGIRYNENGVAIAQKNAIAEGYDGPGAYSGGSSGRNYNRNDSLNYERMNQSAGAHGVEGSSQKLDPDIEQAGRSDDYYDENGKSSPRKMWYWGIGALLVVIVVIVVVVLVVSEGGEDPEKKSPVATEPPVQEEVAIPVEFDESVIPPLSSSSVASRTIAAIVEDPNSPQALAFTWVAEDPNLSDYSNWRRLQRFALATFYHSFNGPKWRTSDDQAKHWMDYEVANECDWLKYEKACRDDGHVRYLKINRLSGFRGFVPPEIALLEKLEEIDLNYNILNMPLGSLFPQELPSSVRIIQCAQCRLDGSLPSEIGLMSRLQGLKLTENSIDGSLPSEMGQMTQLDSLMLEQNGIRGPLPSEIGNMKQLIILALSGNSISGSIPGELGNLPILEVLGLSFNSLSQNIPSGIGRLTNAKKIDFEVNGLTGSLPSEIGLLAKLITLDLLKNDITGHLPTELGQIKLLQWLGFSANSFSGPIPTELGNMNSLQVIDLNFNELTGTIPSELGQLVHLTQLHLGDNFLTGTTPVEIEALPKLNELEVRNR